jgi:peptidoglycan/LPS O-acetylase OafA/YrhL
MEGNIPAFWLNLARMSYCAFAICALLFMAKTYRTWSFLGSGFFKTLDRAAYQIFLSHSLMIFIVDRFLNNYAVVSYGSRYLIRIIVTYAVTVTLCMAWQLLKERLILVSAKKIT